MLLRRLAQLAAVLAVAIGAQQTACSGDPPAVANPDAGTDDSSLDKGVCPLAAPAAKTTCILPEGTTCSFDKCGTSIAMCTKGAWVYASNPPSKPPCPPLVPGIDELCPACFPETQPCVYGSTDCTLEDASPNTATAFCVRSENALKWSVTFKECRPIDASTDVQGDAGLDGD
jgi:hypothetical protein